MRFTYQRYSDVTQLSEKESVYNLFGQITLKKITLVVSTNSHGKSVIISGTIFYNWDYYNHIVKSTIMILYYIFLADIAMKKIFPLREI